MIQSYFFISFFKLFTPLLLLYAYTCIYTLIQEVTVTLSLVASVDFCATKKGNNNNNDDDSDVGSFADLSLAFQVVRMIHTIVFAVC